MNWSISPFYRSVIKSSLCMWQVYPCCLHACTWTFICMFLSMCQQNNYRHDPTKQDLRGKHLFYFFLFGLFWLLCWGICKNIAPFCFIQSQIERVIFTGGILLWMLCYTVILSFFFSILNIDYARNSSFQLC